MMLGTLLRTLALSSVHLWQWVTRYGVRGATRELWQSYSGGWLDLEQLRRTLAHKAQLRLIW